MLVRQKDGTVGCVAFNPPSYEAVSSAGPPRGFPAAIRALPPSRAGSGFSAALLRYPFQVGENVGKQQMVSIITSPMGDSPDDLLSKPLPGGNRSEGLKGARSARSRSARSKRRRRGRMKEHKAANALIRTPSPKAPAKPFVCNQRPPLDRAEIGVLIKVDDKGTVEQVAARGGGAEVLGCCIKPYVARFRFNPKEVPPGIHRFALRLAQGAASSAAVLPDASDLRPLVRPVADCVDSPLNLTLLLTEKGYYLKTRYGSECSDDPGSDSRRLCFRWTRDKAETFKHLARRLFHLFSVKYAHPRFWRFRPDLRGSSTLVPVYTTRFQDVIRAMEILRDLPNKDGAPPAAGKNCRMRMAHETKRWVCDRATKSFCMYPYVTLAVGLQ